MVHADLQPVCDGGQGRALADHMSHCLPIKVRGVAAGQAQAPTQLGRRFPRERLIDAESGEVGCGVLVRRVA